MDQQVTRFSPYEGEEPYIFVSYSHKDSDRVLPLMRRLRDAGFRLWYDEGIDPGAEWPEVIAEHLERSSVCMAFLSPNAVASRNCRREINFALSREIDFLSVILEPTEMSSGLEMQIASYMALLSYQFSDPERFFQKLCSLELLKKCRAGQSGEEKPSVRKTDRPGRAAASKSGGRQNRNNTDRGRFVWIAFLLLGIMLLGAVSLLLADEMRSGSAKEEPVPAAEIQWQPMATPEPAETPEPEATATPEQEATATPEPEPTATPEPTPTPNPEAEPTEPAADSPLPGE